MIRKKAWSSMDDFFNSEDYLDIIIPNLELPETIEPPEEKRIIDDDLGVFYYKRDNQAPLTDQSYPYVVIPRCLGLLGIKDVQAAGIPQVRQTLGLTGKGVLVGLVDTGIDKSASFLRDEFGKTKLMAIWDQTKGTDAYDEILSGGGVEENSRYVSEEGYGNDENGHGTYLASLVEQVAPEGSFVVVKLREAKRYLREYYYIPEQEPAYQENHIMEGIAFCQSVAREKGMPLALCMALGSNNGSHSGSGTLSEYLNKVAGIWGQVVVVATGNEAGKRHHFFGRTSGQRNGIQEGPVEVEINVERDMTGFYLETWAGAPDLYYLEIISPSGKSYSTNYYRSDTRHQYYYPLEGTTVTIDYRSVGRNRGDQLIFVRFDRAKAGIWRILVYPGNVYGGTFHMWLPMEGMLESDVYFLEANPQVTLTMPSAAQTPISVGAYEVDNNAIFINSGRGYTAEGRVKPDFVASGVNVLGTWLEGEPYQYTGTSPAAAITTGAAALVLQWGVVLQNRKYLNSSNVGNFLIQGCKRDLERTYPNDLWGYGVLDLFQSFLES